MHLARRTFAAITLGLALLAGCGGGHGGSALPPKGAMPPSATWNASWQTTFGPLVTEQKGNEVLGIYKYGDRGIVGAILGTVDGNYVFFQWAEKNGAGKGHGVFVIGNDGQTFRGTWGYGESLDDGGDWTGERVE